MARGRMLNKKISNSRRVNDLPEPAQLLFTWLISHLDCNGNFYGGAQMVKSLVIPRKNISKTRVEQWLKLMEETVDDENTPLIVRYFVDGDQYLHMPGFTGEQVGLRHDKERPDFPMFDGTFTERIRQKDGVSRTEGEVEGEQNRTEGERKEPAPPLVDSEFGEIVQTFEKTTGHVITPYNSERLDELRKTYTAEWLSDAIKQAVETTGKWPGWKYVEAILERWSEQGKDDRRKLGTSMKARDGPGKLPTGEELKESWGKEEERSSAAIERIIAKSEEREPGAEAPT